MKLVIVPQALAELQDVAAFYTARANVELGLAFVAEFERTTKLILTNPMLGTIFRNSRRFPYGLIYQVTENELRGIAVAHHRRHPNYWVNRK